MGGQYRSAFGGGLHFADVKADRPFSAGIPQGGGGISGRKKYIGYNCYVLQKELFERLCRFQLPILFEVERYQQGHSTLSRIFGYVGEILYGIFMYQITKLEKWRIRELQLVLFDDTAPIKNCWDLAWRNIKQGVDRALRTVIDPIMPKGSKQREWVKNIFYMVISAKRRGAATPESRDKKK